MKRGRNLGNTCGEEDVWGRSRGERRVRSGVLKLSKESEVEFIVEKSLHKGLTIECEGREQIEICKYT